MNDKRTDQRDSIPAETAMLWAFELEFNLLDPAFNVLFFLLAEQSGETRAADAYQHHIEAFQAQVKRMGMENPLIDLIARQTQLLLNLNQQRARDLAEIYSLRNILPICMHCHKIRDDNDHWERVETYIMQRTGAAPSHGICPECMEKHYGDLMEFKED